MRPKLTTIENEDVVTICYVITSLFSNVIGLALIHLTTILQ